MASLPQILATLWGKKKAPIVAMEYRQALSGRNLVLQDLAIFCGVVGEDDSNGALDMAVMKGRRQVFHRIAAMLRLTPEDFNAILNQRNIE